MNNRINFSRRLRLPTDFVGGTGSPPVHFDRGRRLFYSPSMQGHNPLGLNAYLSKPPAMHATARVNSFAELLKVARALYADVDTKSAQLGSTLKQMKLRYKEGGFKTWSDCVSSTFPNRSDKWADKILREYDDETLGTTTGEVVTNEPDKPKVEPLKPKPLPQGPDSEEGPPTPRARTEAGKPKRDLSIWKEIEERLLGVAANRVDTLNHECPNPVFHKKLQDQLSACFQTLAMWRESVK